jgi:hypothetical protein
VAKFGPGNQAAKGHGRPRRAVEADYHRRLADRVGPADFDAIVDKAIAQAAAGDAAARSFVIRWLMGDSPAPGGLAEIAARELAGHDPVAHRAEDLLMIPLRFTPPSGSPLDVWARAEVEPEDGGA